MDARFRQLILQQVDGALNKEPCRASLLDLLKIADPVLSDETLNNDIELEGALCSLLVLIHPDEHPGDSQRATTRFQDAHSFFSSCCAVLNENNRPKAGYPTSVKFPVAFHVQDKWNFLEKSMRVRVRAFHPFRVTFSKAIAVKCINIRGTITHGKHAELYHSCQNVCKREADSVERVFQAFGGSLKLNSIEAIKQEIMNRGPVVSTSFLPTQGFMNATEHSGFFETPPGLFETSLVDGAHPLLIVGWKLSAAGEMWLVRSICGSHDIPIAVGQFCVEDKVLAPSCEFDQWTFQNQRKAFDYDGFANRDWYSLKEMEIQINSSAFEELCGIMELELSEASAVKERFVLRDKFKRARSRWALIKNATWLESEKMWKVELVFGVS